LETSLEGFTSQPDPEGNITFFGDWTVTGGSGRFRNGTGSGTYFGSGNAAVAPVPISFDGEISLREAVWYAEAGDRVTFNTALDGGEIVFFKIDP